MYKLGEHNLWFDEFTSYIHAIGRYGYVYINSTDSYSFRDFNPFLYIYILSGWIRLFGSSEFAMRSLSMAAGLLSIALIYKLGKLLFDSKTGLLSAFILSISPIHIWYSQEARGISLSILLVMLTVYFSILVLRHNTIRLWAGFAVFSVLALYTNYFSIFPVVLIAPLFLTRNYRPLLKNYLISLVFIIIVFMPIIPSFSSKFENVKNINWILAPELRSLAVTFINFNIGYNSAFWTRAIASLIFFSLFIFSISYWRHEKRKELLFLVLLFSVPVSSVFLFSQVIPIYLDRHLLLFSPFYYVIVAAGLGKISSRGIMTAVTFLIVALNLICLNNYFSYIMPLPYNDRIGVHVKRPVKPAADYINRGFRDSDLVAISDISIWNIQYYLPDIPRERIVYFFANSQFSYTGYTYKRMKEVQEYRLRNGLRSSMVNLEEESSIPGVRKIREVDFKRVWLVSSSWEKDGILGGHTRFVRLLAKKNGLLLESKKFDGVYVELYLKQ